MTAHLTTDLPPEELAILRAELARPGTIIPLPKRRFFCDRDLLGNEYLVPADKRFEWDAWDIACEEAGELLPVPEWARRLKDQIRWVEFECPVEVTVPDTIMDDYDAWVGEPAPSLPGDDE